MRLDQFLKASRLVLQRSRAQTLCEAGAVTVNDTVARSSRTVRANDEIKLRRGARTLVVKVVEVPVIKQVSRERAAELYEIISDETRATDEDAGGDAIEVG